MQTRLLERFLRYVAVTSQSDASQAVVPSTEGQRSLAELLKKDLEEKGAKNVVLTDLSRDDMSKALADAFRFTKLVVACATYDGGLFPCMEDFL